MARRRCSGAWTDPANVFFDAVDCACTWCQLRVRCTFSRSHCRVGIFVLEVAVRPNAASHDSAIGTFETYRPTSGLRGIADDLRQRMRQNKKTSLPRDCLLYTSPSPR